MKWIDIREQKPKEGQRVIYYFRHTGVSSGRYTHTEDGHCFYGLEGWLTDDVTHWMPFPDPPKLEAARKGKKE